MFTKINLKISGDLVVLLEIPRHENRTGNQEKMWKEFGYYQDYVTINIRSLACYGLQIFSYLVSNRLLHLKDYTKKLRERQ